MKLYSCIAISSLLIASVASAQAGNRTLRNNNPYLVISGGTNATTGTSYNWPPVNHPDFSNGVGVPQGTRLWRCIHPEADVRQEQIRHTGWTILLRASAATAAGYYFYSPASQLYRVRNRTASEMPSPTAFGPGLVPDFNQPVGQASVEMPMPTLAAHTVRNNISHAPSNVRFSFNGQLNGYAIVMDYHGGEEQDIPQDAVNLVYSQGFVSSWQDGPFAAYDDVNTTYTYVPEGWVDSNTGAITFKTTSQYRTWVGILSDNPTIAMYSDWGQRDYGALSATLRGHSDGTCYANLGSDSFYLGFSVRADGTFTGGQAVLHMNVTAAGMFPTFIPVPLGALGTLTYELAPFDPLFFTGLVVPLGGSGEVDFDILDIGGAGPGNFPPQPALIGQWLGFEATVIDGGLTFADTTGAQYVYVVN